MKPKIVTLCGSTRFKDAFTKAQLDETLAGKIVLTIGCNMRTDADIFSELSEEEMERTKKRLDWLHMRKIELSDEILVLNVDGYVGESTSREIAYAYIRGLLIRWLEPERTIRNAAAVHYSNWRNKSEFFELIEENSALATAEGREPPATRSKNGT